MDTTILLFLNHGKYIPLILQSGQKTTYQLGEKEHILVPYIFFVWSAPVGGELSGQVKRAARADVANLKLQDAHENGSTRDGASVCFRSFARDAGLLGSCLSGAFQL